jgi:multidrug resistance efflux pump
LVEKVLVTTGQPVKKGTPLAELFSDELVAAKNTYLYKSLVWQVSQRLYDLRKPLVENGAISQQLWVDSQNERDKCRHELSAARDRLLLYGLSPREIDAIKEDDEDKANFTLRSPVDGTVSEIEAGPQDLSDPKSVLMLIRTARP